MKLYIGKSKVELSNEELERLYLGSGNEADVYLYKKEILKIYNSSSKKKLDEEEVKEMSSIQTKRILLPKDPIYDENNQFIGYTRKYVSDYYKEIVGKMTVPKFIEELSMIEDDIDILSQNKVDVEDFNMDNTLVGDEIYLSDPGSYIKMDELRSSQVHANNVKTLNEFIVNELIPSSTKLPKKEYYKLAKKLLEEEKISYYLSAQSYNDKETVKSYIRKLSITLSK